MDSMDPSTALTITLVLLAVGGIIFIVDLVIFIRWLLYKNEISIATQFPLPPPEIPQPPQGADLPWPPSPMPELPASPVAAPPMEAGAAAPNTIPPVETPTDPGASAPYPPPHGIVSPFAPKWSVVDPFISFQAIFVVVQVISTLFLLPAILPGLFGAASTPPAATGTHTGRPLPGAAQHNPPASSPGSGKPGSSVLSGASTQSMGMMNDILASNYGLAVVVGTLILQNVLFVGVVGFYLRRYRSSFQEIGLRKPTAREILLGLGLGVALFALAGGAEQGLGLVLKHVSPELAERLAKITDSLSAGGMFEQIHNNGWKLAFLLTGAIAAPIGEEIFFRGFLYNALKRRWGIMIGVVFSGLAFALIHFAPLAVIVIFPMGMLLAYVYEKTRSLWVTIMMHIFNNGAAFLLAWFLPQLGK